MSATIRCNAEIQDEIVERVISELIEVLEPLDLDVEWDEAEDQEEALAAAVEESVVVTEKGIKVEYPVDDVYCDDVDEYTNAIVQIFKNLKADYPDIAILRGSVYVEDKYDEEYKHGFKFSCSEKDTDLKVKRYM